MTTKEGTVLGPLEIINEYGIVYKYKNDLPRGEPIWIYYDGQGRLINIEAKSKVIINVPIENKNKK